MPSTRKIFKSRFYLLLRNAWNFKFRFRFLAFAFLFFFAGYSQSQDPSPQFSVDLEFRADCLPGQTHWQLTDSEGNIINEESYSGYSFPAGSGPHNYTFDLSEGCYTFTVYDSGNNGMNSGGSFFCWNDGDFTLSMEDEILAELEDPAFGSSVSYTFCLEAGCIDPMASNYNDEAIVDDGSCEYEAPEATFAYSIAQSGCGFTQVNFEATSSIPADFSWSFSDGSPLSGSGSSFSTTLTDVEQFEVTLTATNDWGSIAGQAKLVGFYTTPMAMLSRSWNRENMKMSFPKTASHKEHHFALATAATPWRLPMPTVMELPERCITIAMKTALSTLRMKLVNGYSLLKTTPTLARKHLWTCA